MSDPPIYLKQYEFIFGVCTEILREHIIACTYVYVTLVTYKLKITCKQTFMFELIWLFPLETNIM